jgi:hypothetical protein
MNKHLQNKQKQFLSQTFKNHIEKEKTNIQNWINIHFDKMESQIQDKEQNINRKHYIIEKK